MTHDRAKRLDALIRAGADDATLLAEGYSAIDIHFQRLFTEGQMRVESLQGRSAKA